MIGTLGNAQDYGDLSSASWACNGCSNSVRGLIGAIASPARSQTDYITIATGGNSVNFGDLTDEHNSIASTASPTRGIFAGGSPNNATINCFNINTQGDAVVFGDLSVGRARFNAASNAHGGL